MRYNEKNGLKLISEITLEKGKIFYLYSDGNIYGKDDEGNLVMIDRLKMENRQLIDKIMNRFKPGRTDVIRNRELQKNENFKKRTTEDLER